MGCRSVAQGEENEANGIAPRDDTITVGSSNTVQTES